VRKLQDQDGNVVGEEEPATPKKVFQLLNEVNYISNLLLLLRGPMVNVFKCLTPNCPI
jgi:hypothetical protein